MIESIIAISAFTLGLSLLGEEGKLLHRVKTWVKKLFTYNVTYQKAVTTKANATAKFQDVVESRVHWTFDPIWGCPACMASIWGTAVYWIGAEMNYWPGDLFGWVVSCLGACFLNALLWKQV